MLKVDGVRPRGWGALVSYLKTTIDVVEAGGGSCANI